MKPWLSIQFIRLSALAALPGIAWHTFILSGRLVMTYQISRPSFDTEEEYEAAAMTTPLHMEFQRNMEAWEELIYLVGYPSIEYHLRRIQGMAPSSRPMVESVRRRFIKAVGGRA